MGITGNGSAVTVTPGQGVYLTTPAGVEINLTIGVSVEIFVNVSSTNPAGDLPDNASGIGQFITIELNNSNIDIDI